MAWSVGRPPVCHDMPTPKGGTSADEHGHRSQNAAPSPVPPSSNVLTWHFPATLSDSLNWAADNHASRRTRTKQPIPRVTTVYSTSRAKPVHGLKAGPTRSGVPFVENRTRPMLAGR